MTKKHDHTTFDSTCLRTGDFAYDKSRGVLTVTMQKPGGAASYSYPMSRRQYRYLRDEAPSPGGYYNRKLKGNEL